MMTAFILALAGGFGLTIYASRGAVSHARLLAEGTAIPPFIIGVTLFAVGTDLPEIANSIIASLAGHGDLNVGDSVGSATTQVTLVLGLLPLVVGAFVVGSERIARPGIVTVVALLAGAYLFSDGDITRIDAALLISMWIAGSLIIWHGLPEAPEPVMRIRPRRSVEHALITVVMLVGVTIGASVVVWALIGIADAFSVPEYTIAFVVAAIGTSLPEFAVGLTALRAGTRDLAIGDVIGSSFADSTLSIGSGPLIAPTLITASLAVKGSLIAAAVVLAVVLLLSWRRHHTRVTGAACIALWLVAYIVLTA
ncbi:MAG: hypothetical protein ABFS21_12125 [Actinomycetota bacterium]